MASSGVRVGRESPRAMLPADGQGGFSEKVAGKQRGEGR